MRDGTFSRIAALVGTISTLLYLSLTYRYSLPTIITALQHPLASHRSTMAVNTDWHAPLSSWITDLNFVINGTGVGGFMFNSSSLPSTVPYGTYNWCNMPHVRKQEYPVPGKKLQLQYVEVVCRPSRMAIFTANFNIDWSQIHRHHKRTPYASNTFPVEAYPWDCSDQGLFYYGETLNPTGHEAARTYWSIYTSPSNPLAPSGFNGSCQFPQITRGGLDDSFQHGRELYGVYHDLLNFLPDAADESVKFRVTNNVITSQVAGMVVSAMYPSKGPYPLQIQPSDIDSLEPRYACAAASALSASYATGSNNTAWTLHLNASKALFTSLDAISNVPRDDEDWHTSWDHYFDNLSARQCHDKPLPCNISNPALCITQQQANAVYRLGQYEYSYIYRGAPESLPYAVRAYGIWMAELAQNMRDAISGTGGVKYRHNIAHDGSVSKLLALLQIDQMVWPGMGSEVVFEIWKGREGKNFLRVLWGGQVLKSSNPIFGMMDMIDVDVFLAYIDALVGRGAVKIPALCEERE